ncbi:MAG: hypothetical protein COB50_04340 [Thiotrichales bacterium]|nr:MAG: hypothetical protein COB50_04340 [Thiotrichales bacterium]
MNIKAINKIFSGSILALSLGMAASSAHAALALDGIAATVNGNIITTAELHGKTRSIKARLAKISAELPDHATLQRQVLEKMILAEVQMQMARERGLQVADTKVNAAIRNIAKQQQLTVKQLQDSLKQQGISFSEFRKSVHNDLLISQLQQYELEDRVNISDRELENFVNSPSGQNQAGIEYNVAHILFSVPENPDPKTLNRKRNQAQQIATQLKSGKAKFSTTAIAKSSGINALQGGKLGWRKIDDLPTIFVKHVVTMLPNEIYGPIRSPNGFHIIKLLAKRVGKQALGIESRVQHILIAPNDKLSLAKAQNKIVKIRSKIIKGASFAKLAKEFSNETSSAASGGDLGWVNPKNVLAAVNKAIARTKVDTISEPFKTTLGWHIIKVNERRGQQGSKLSKNQALEILHQRKFNGILPIWLTTIKAKAKIEVFI